MFYQKIYKILTYLLYPFALLFAINVVSSVLVSLTNPAMLLIFFILACVPLYVFFSSKFFFLGILQAKPCKKSLKDLIIVNAVVSILFSLFILLGCLMVMSVIDNPDVIKEMTSQMTQMQQQAFAKFTPQEIIKILKMFVAIFVPFSLILITHIILTFNLVKRFNHIFTE